jgi:predicted porin
MNQKQNYWDGAIRWTPGPFGAAVAYGQNKQEVPVTGTTTTKITEVSGNWDNKAFGIYATYSKHKTDVPTATGASDWKIWNVSGVARFGGVHEVYLMGGQAKQSIAVAGAEPKTSLYGIVYENVLSKRTRLYAGYGYAKNEGGATLAPTAYAAAPATQIGITSTVSAATNVAPNEKPKGFQLGISHTF